MKKLITLSYGCALALAGGCTAMPSKPAVMALPGAGMTFEQFQVDNSNCEGFAASQLKNESNAEEYELQLFYDMAYLQCMYGKGHRVPVSGQFPGADQPGGSGANNGIPLPPEGTPPAPPSKMNPPPAR